MYKEALRRNIKALIQEHSPRELADLSALVGENILRHPRVQAAHAILLYHSLPDEVDTRRLIETLLAQGKQVLLPKVCHDSTMTLHAYSGASSVTVGAYGIMEPTGPSQPVPPVAVIPGRAFDRQGYRLGRGKGYYDRLLAHAATYKIGICFPFQFTDTVPHDFHDVPMDEVVTC